MVREPLIVAPNLRENSFNSREVRKETAFADGFFPTGKALS